MRGIDVFFRNIVFVNEFFRIVNKLVSEKYEMAEQYLYDLKKAQLKASSNTSALLSGKRLSNSRWVLSSSENRLTDRRRVSFSPMRFVLDIYETEKAVKIF